MNGFSEIRAELTSADVASSLHTLTQKGIILKQVETVDDLTVRFTVSTLDFQKAEGILKGQMLRPLAQVGVGPKLLRAGKRPVLLGILVLILCLTAFLPRRILFIDVAGNTHVPTALILEQAEACGIRFGAKRSAVRSEKVKNALLNRIPELKWAAVTTKGCTATIHLREEPVQNTQTPFSPMNLYAVRDGILQEITVLRGTAMCKPGDAVKEGQLLISGFTDCGISIQAGGAQGEVYALTQRSVQCYAMKPTYYRQTPASKRTGYTLRVGKKLIKFYKDSGISDAGCVKIQSRWCVHLPGGFTLPVEIIREQWQSASCVESGQTDYTWLAGNTRNYVLEQMCAGSILNQQCDLLESDDGAVLDSNFSCREMIVHTNSEEYTQEYGKRN